MPLTPHERERKFHLAFTRAAMDFDPDKVVKMAAAVKWRWREEVIDRFMVVDLIERLHKWALQHNWDKPLDYASHYTGGMFLAAHEYDSDDGQTHVDVKILWGESSEGDSE